MPAAKPDKITPFGQRLLQAFGGTQKQEIARLLGYKGASSVTDIIAGRTQLTVEQLLLVSELTKCSIHWLVTGEGEETVGPLGYVSEAEREIVRALAEGREVDVGEMVRELILKGLAATGSEKFSRLGELDERELRELRILSELIPEVGELERPRKKK